MTLYIKKYLFLEERKMSKKLISLLLVLVMVIACFASCGLIGGKDNGDGSKDDGN